ncbi:glycosyltransferase family 4 protein [Pseudanabaena sp. BC1403]|uniref:glycosyltransferase family 4 protein n=1 Tax=Pseudanabaena sp. BC1403 TaxID=2043171 RepID=UPI000CD98FAA|nr:glycosyltransferase family 4 protein [Pseudanabaena sp. BC1403]
MSNHKYRVLIVASHPVQYASPLFKLMAKHPKLNIQVAYCSMNGVQASYDDGFGIEVAWDIPLLEGFPWIQVENNSPKPSLGGKFWGLINLGLWNLIAKENFDAVIVYTGYTYASFWIAVLSAKLTRKKFLFCTDTSRLEPRNKQRVKTWLKKLLLPPIFNLADIVMVNSTPGKQVARSLGMSEERIALTPFAVDNDWWISQTNEVDRQLVRKKWNVPPDSAVLLFCAKLQPWKRPQDVLKAFAKANVPNSYLIFAGDGTLRVELELEAESLEIKHRVRFLGFVNQSKLSSVYCSSDLFVLSSDYEPFGVVVNEAMLCGCPVIVSDKVGAGYDLIRHGENGFIYPCGDVEQLTKILIEILANRKQLRTMGVAATERMKSWSLKENTEAIVQALDKLIEPVDLHPEKVS